MGLVVAKNISASFARLSTSMPPFVPLPRTTLPISPYLRHGLLQFLYYRCHIRAWFPREKACSMKDSLQSTGRRECRAFILHEHECRYSNNYQNKHATLSLSLPRRNIYDAYVVLEASAHSFGCTDSCDMKTLVAVIMMAVVHWVWATRELNVSSIHHGFTSSRSGCHEDIHR